MQAIEKMLELYEDGAISKQRFSERITTHEKTKVGMETKIERLTIAMAGQVNSVTLPLLSRFKAVMAFLPAAVAPQALKGKEISQWLRQKHIEAIVELL